MEEIIKIPEVDTWVCPPEDVIFSNAKGIISAPISKVLQINSDSPGIDWFLMSTKKCYNSQVMRDHTCLYLNYFEKYYDTDKELLIILSRIKFLIDTTPQYSEVNFLNDIRVYILNERFKSKVNDMVDRNYSLNLAYRNIPENLQYTDLHAKIMLRMSIFMNICIPLITHFAYTKKIGVIDDFIMQVFDLIFCLYPEVDIASKLYETTITNVNKSVLKNAPIWAQQDIRGKDEVTHTYMSITNIILNIMPKYTFDKSIISLNFTSIQKNTSCQVLDKLLVPYSSNTILNNLLNCWKILFLLKYHKLIGQSAAKL